MGLLKSLISAALFQVIIKCLIGGLRPHFLIVCNPQIPAGLVGSGYQQLYFTREVCTGDKKDINDAVESLPSGHATAAFAGFIYFSLYLNAQLKLVSAHNPAYWKMLLFLAPILGALLISLAMTLDSYHHWWDILVGGLIGTFCAFVAFRTTFASVWDFRFNHVLLPRTTSLFLRRPMEEKGLQTFGYVLGEGVSWPVVTREGGWGDVQEQVGGAPFDASAMHGRAAVATGTGFGGMGGGRHAGVPRHSADASTAV
ncbi:hypothetical protein FRC17_003217 [Serendipita sp. 399]|nr:hypothetical protein FRC17_003217 [Serendipita sp. 399]